MPQWNSASTEAFPGMTANVRIINGVSRQALRLPAAALRFHPPQTTVPAAGAAKGQGKTGRRGGASGARTPQAVYTLEQGKLKRVPVKLGLSDGNYTEVHSGLNEGQLVVTGTAQTNKAATPAGRRQVPGRAALASRRGAVSDFIRIENLTKIYTLGDVAVRALDGVSTTVERGSFLAIMGPSGSGKSTFMNILGCLDRPTFGTYTLDGENVGDLERDQLAEIRNRKIGFVFQQFNLLARTTAIENVELPLLYSSDGVDPDHERAMNALRIVGLAERAGHRPNQLSGGQQQRVAIARSLINNPRIILADEPTGALDSRTSIEIMAIFQRLNREQGISIILVTHEPDISQYAERMIAFKDGRIVSDQPVRDRLDAEWELRREAIAI